MAPVRWWCRSPPLGMASSSARKELGSRRAHWNASSMERGSAQAAWPAGASTGAGVAERHAAVSKQTSIRPVKGRKEPPSEWGNREHSTPSTGRSRDASERGPRLYRGGVMLMRLLFAGEPSINFVVGSDLDEVEILFFSFQVADKLEQDTQVVASAAGPGTSQAAFQLVGGELGCEGINLQEP